MMLQQSTKSRLQDDIGKLVKCSIGALLKVSQLLGHVEEFVGQGQYVSLLGRHILAHT
jgi:hypothetical protein